MNDITQRLQFIANNTHDVMPEEIEEVCDAAVGEIATLRWQREALASLAREGNYGVRGWRDDNRETSSEYVERRIAEIMGERDG